MLFTDKPCRVYFIGRFYMASFCFKSTYFDETVSIGTGTASYDEHKVGLPGQVSCRRLTVA